MRTNIKTPSRHFPFQTWFIKVRKIKAIYHTLNFFNLDVTQKCLIAECWIPTADIESIQLALRRGTEKSGSSVAPILNTVRLMRLKAARCCAR